MRMFRLALLLGLAVCPGCEQPPPPRPPAERLEIVDEASFQEKVLDAPVPVLVDFYADWCRPCKILAPLLEEIANDNPNAKIVKVNVDKSPRLAARYQVRGIPTLKVFKDGQVVAQHVGLADKGRLESLLSQ